MVPLGSQPRLSTLLWLFACSTPARRPLPGRMGGLPSDDRADARRRRSYKQAVHFDSSFSYCSVVGAAVFVFKVHLVHVSGVRWRFN